MKRVVTIITTLANSVAHYFLGSLHYDNDILIFDTQLREAATAHARTTSFFGSDI